MIFLFGLLVFAAELSFPRQHAAPQEPIKTDYNPKQDKTTVRLAPVKIAEEKAQYHSVHVAPSFSYPGHTFKRPDSVDFEVQTVVKTKLKIDLYVEFVIDGEKVFLSSNRSAVKRPIPRRRWVGERLVFRMPYDALMKLVSAKSVEIRMDGVSFPFSDAALERLREFAKQLQ